MSRELPSYHDLVRQGPGRPIVFDYVGFTKASKRERAREKREQAAAIFELVERSGLWVQCGGDMVVLAGSFELTVDRLKHEPGFFAEALRRGEDATAWYPLPEEEPQPGPVQLTLANDPSGALADLIAADGLERVSGPDARPVIVMGQGLLESYKALIHKGDRATRSAPPGGVVRGCIQGATCPPGPGSSSRSDQTPAAAAPSGHTAEATLPPEREDDESADTTSERAYRSAALSPSADGTPLHSASSKHLEALVEEAVRQEGPVALETVLIRVRDGYGLSAIKANTREKLGDAAKRLVSQGVLALSDERFLNPPGRPVVARTRSQAEDRVRSVAELPPVELRAAVVEELGHNGELTPETLVTGCSARLGLLLRSSAAKAALNAMVTDTIRVLAADDTLVVAEDGRVKLAIPPLTPLSPDSGPAARAANLNDTAGRDSLDKPASDSDRTWSGGGDELDPTGTGATSRPPLPGADGAGAHPG